MIQQADDLEIQKTLVISTAHLPQRLAEIMDEGDELPGRALAYEKFFYGYRVLVPDPLEEVHLLTNNEEEDMLSLISLTLFARRHGCTWLALDCDGKLLPAHLNFPTYQWQRSNKT